MQRTLLILGGSRYILPVIEEAHRLGVRVVTCDYLPNNYAHRYADEYVNASIVDKEAVLGVAESVKADGIISFAADPGVLSAAYVAEKLQLPFQASYNSTKVLQRKNMFRSFLRTNGFACPQSWAFSSWGQIGALSFPYPVIVKPTDSAGSKGVSRVDSDSELYSAFLRAKEFSLGGEVIVEQFIEKSGHSSDCDSFTIDGVFTCVTFDDQLFDARAENEYVPSGYVLPPSMSNAAQQELKSELQRLANLLGLRTGIYNIEARVGTDGVPYIMEVSPRGGGNRLAEFVRTSSGVDLIKATVLGALGEKIENLTQPEYHGFWYQEILHSQKSGRFKGIKYDPDFKAEHLVEESLWIGKGDKVEGFSAANYAYGTAVLHFATRNDLAYFLANKESLLEFDVD